MLSIVASRSRAILLAVCALNLALSIFVGRVVLRDFPNSGDEYADLVSAQLFAEGRLSVPSPEPRRAFDALQVINDGAFYGKYSPGWPALLSLGVRAGASWIVNPLLGCLALILIHRMAAAEFGPAVASIAALSLAASPFLVFNAASYFAHPAALCALTAFLWTCIRVDAGDGRSAARTFVMMGASFGVALIIRPYTSVAVALPVLIALAVRAHRRGAVSAVARGGIPFVVGATPLVLLLLLYNHGQTGHALLQPFTLYDPNDRPFSTPESLSYWWGLKHNLVLRLGLLTIWQPLSVVLLLFWMYERGGRPMRQTGLLVTAILGLVGFYLVYLFNPGNEYGPRYLFEALGAIVIVGACAIQRLGRRAVAVLALIIVTNVGWLASRSYVYGQEVRERMRPFDLAEAQHLSHAIVFMETSAGTMLARDLTRNGIHFDGPVLFVRNRGADNAEVLARYPERRPYAFRYDARTGRSGIVPY